MARLAIYPLRPGVGALASYWLDSLSAYAVAADLPIHTATVLITVLWEDLKHYVRPDGDLSRRPANEKEPPRHPVSMERLRTALPGFDARLDADLDRLLNTGWIDHGEFGFVARSDAQLTPELDHFRRENRASILRLLERASSHLDLSPRTSPRRIRSRPVRADLAWAGFAAEGASALCVFPDQGLDLALVLLAAIKAQCGVPASAREYPNCFRALWDGRSEGTINADDLASILGLDLAKVTAVIDRLERLGLVAFGQDGRRTVTGEALTNPQFSQAYDRVWRGGIDLISTTVGFGLQPSTVTANSRWYDQVPPGA